MKLTVVAGENFSCHGCSNCCRNWHVELLDSEAKKIPSLAWPASDPLHAAKVTMSFGGKTFVAHRADGTCVYLDLKTNRCRIHEAFGEEAKPVGCRLFPFHMTRVSKDQVTVTARYDCPSVQKNAGAPHKDSVDSLQKIASQISLGPGLDDHDRCMLDHEQVQAVGEFAGAMLNSFRSSAHKSLFIFLLCDWLSQTPVEELDRQALANAYADLSAATRSIDPARVLKPTSGVALSFRSLWALYLRRDEDVLDKRISRTRRGLSLARVSLLGSGSLNSLGLSHPKAPIAGAKLFADEPGSVVTEQALAVHWRMIKNKLDSLQFMGPANHDKNLLDGLKSLALLYPLVLATARVSAAGRGSTQVEADDVKYAVGTIDHGFGRLAILKTPAAVSLEQNLLSPANFVRVVCRV